MRFRATFGPLAVVDAPDDHVRITYRKRGQSQLGGDDICRAKQQNTSLTNCLDFL